MFETSLFKTQFIPAAKPSEYLMIVLHGKGDSIKPFAKFNEELEIDNVHMLLVNAPKKYLDGFSWYGDPPYQNSGVLKIRAKMVQLISELKSHGWKSQNIFLFGFSQGCLVSTDFVLHYPESFGGLIGVSGYFNFYSRWKRQVTNQAVATPWLLTHGKQDKVLKFEETAYGIKKLKGLGLKIDFVERNKAHVLEEEEYPIIRRWIKEKIQTQSL